MATASRRVRRERRVKRERTLLQHQVQYQQGQIQTLVGMLVKQRKELTDTAAAIEEVMVPTPAFTMTTLPDEDSQAADLVNIELPEYVTEDLNRDCCIDDSPSS
jgi:hypothetical protein